KSEMSNKKIPDLAGFIGILLDNKAIIVARGIILTYRLGTKVDQAGQSRLFPVKHMIEPVPWKCNDNGSPMRTCPWGAGPEKLPDEPLTLFGGHDRPRFHGTVACDGP